MGIIMIEIAAMIINYMNNYKYFNYYLILLLCEKYLLKKFNNFYLYL